MVATVVNRVGLQEEVGVDVFTQEDGAAWLGFLLSPVARGLSGGCWPSRTTTWDSRQPWQPRCQGISGSAAGCAFYAT